MLFHRLAAAAGFVKQLGDLLRESGGHSIGLGLLRLLAPSATSPLGSIAAVLRVCLSSARAPARCCGNSRASSDFGVGDQLAFVMHAAQADQDVDTI